MGRLSGFKYKQIIKKLRKLQFQFLRQAKGSHELWYNPVTDKIIVVPKHSGEMPEGTLNAILKQGEVEIDVFLTIK